MSVSLQIYYILVTRREMEIGLAVTEIEKIAAQNGNIHTATDNFHFGLKLELEAQKVVKHILLIVLSSK